MKRLRSILVTGILVLVPIMLTVELLRWLMGAIDDGVRNLRLVEDHRQFVRAKHRHCADRYAAGAPDAPPHRH